MDTHFIYPQIIEPGSFLVEKILTQNSTKLTLNII